MQRIYRSEAGPGARVSDVVDGVSRPSPIWSYRRGEVSCHDPSASGRPTSGNSSPQGRAYRGCLHHKPGAVKVVGVALTGMAHDEAHA